MSLIFTPHQLQVFKILCSVIPTTVGVATVLRLWVKQPRRWWCDDLFVAIGVVAMIVHQAIFWELSIYQPPTMPVFYVVVSLIQTQIWFARFSILASVIHITPTPRIKFISQCCFGLFGLLYVISLAQIFWVCQTDLEKISGVPHCVFSRQVPIWRLSAAVVADSILIILPIHAIRLLNGEPILRRRLAFIFAASGATTVVTFVNTMLIVLNVGFGLILAAHMECWISLLVCNFSILTNASLKAIFPVRASGDNVESSGLKFRSTSTWQDSTASRTVAGGKLDSFNPDHVTSSTA